MDKYLYFATFHTEEDGEYSISFYDLPGCYTFGKDIEDGMKNAKEALELHLFGMEDDNDKIPEPTKPIDIKLEANEFTVPIKVYMKPIREKMNNKAVKKTLTIPYWLNKLAEKEKINFSSLLQSAIKETLGINDDYMNLQIKRMKNEIYTIAYNKNDLRKYEHLSYQLGRALFYDGVDLIKLVRNYLPKIKSNPVDIEKIIFTIQDTTRKSLLMELFLPGYSFDDNLNFEYMCFLGYTEAFNNVEEEYVYVEQYCYENNIEDSYNVINEIIKSNSGEIDEIHDRAHFVKKDILQKYI